MVGEQGSSGRSGDPGGRGDGGAGAGGSTRAGGPDARDGSNVGRRVLKWVGAAAAAVLVLYLAAAVALRTLVPPETVAGWAEPRAEASLNRDVEIGGAELTIFPHLGVALQDVTVGNLAAFQGPPVAEVDRAELRVALLPLVRGDVVIDEAVARGLTVRLQVDEEGDTNFGDLVPATEDTATARGRSLPLSLAVRSVGLRGSSVEYHDRRSGRRVHLDSLDLRGSLAGAEGGTWELGADVEIGAFTADLPAVRETPFRPGGVSARVAARSGGDFGWLELREGRVVVGGVPLSLTGRVDSLDAPVRRLSLTLAADSLELASLAGSAPAGAIPEAVEALEGVAGLRVGLTGPAGGGRLPDVDGILRLRRAGATLAGRGRVATGLTGSLRITGDSAWTDGLEGTVLGGPFRLAGRLDLDSTRTFRARLESDVSLASLSPEGSAAGASGGLSAALDLSGRGTSLAATTARGTLELRDLLLPADSPRAAVRVPAGTLRFRGSSVTWSELPVEVGGDRLTTGGSLDGWGGLLADGAGRPRLRARVQGPRLDLGHLLPQEGDAPTYGQLVFARLGRDSIGGRSAGEVAAELGYRRPGSLPVTGELELSLDTLLFDPYRFEPATARLEFGSDLIRIPSAELGLFGGRMQQSLSVSLGGADAGDPASEAAGQPFSVRLTGSGLRAADFLATTSPLGRLLTGTLSLEIEAAGRLDRSLLPVRDSFVGRGRLTADGGGLSPNAVTGAVSSLLSYPALRSPSVQRIVAPFRIRGGEVRFDTARLVTPAGGLQWSGALDLAGGLELGARLQVPRERLSQIDLRGAGVSGDLLSRLQKGSGPLELGLALGGTLGSPSVGLDTDALRARAKEALRGAAEEAVQERIEEGRGRLEKKARGLLRRLTGSRDTAVADTARADTTGAR